MVAILENGDQLKFRVGNCGFRKHYILTIVYAKFGAFITKWKIALLMCSTNLGTLPRTYLRLQYSQEMPVAEYTLFLGVS